MEMNSPARPDVIHVAQIDENSARVCVRRGGTLRDPGKSRAIESGESDERASMSRARWLDGRSAYSLVPSCFDR